MTRPSLRLSKGGPAGGSHQVFGTNASRQVLNVVLPMLVAVLRFGGVLVGILALLTAHFVFGQAGFALAIKYNVPIWLPFFGEIDLKPGVFAILLEVAAQAIQIVLWDKILNGKYINRYIKPLYMLVVFLLVLVNISVVTQLMYGQSSLNIFPDVVAPGYILAALLVGLLTMFDSYFIAKAIETLRQEGDSAIFGTAAMKSMLGGVVLLAVSAIRFLIMVGGTLALLAVTFIFGEVAFALFFQHGPTVSMPFSDSVVIQPGVFAGILSAGVVGIAVILADVIVHKRANCSRLLKVSFGSVVALTGLCSAAVVPWLMYRDDAVALLPASGHYSTMYFVIALLAFTFTVFESYLIVELLGSVSYQTRASSTSAGGDSRAGE